MVQLQRAVVYAQDSARVNKPLVQAVLRLPLWNKVNRDGDLCAKVSAKEIRELPSLAYKDAESSVQPGARIALGTLRPARVKTSSSCRASFGAANYRRAE